MGRENLGASLLQQAHGNLRMRIRISVTILIINNSIMIYYLDQSGRGALEKDEVQDSGDEAKREVGGKDGEEPGRGVQGGVSLQPDQ